ncbi:MAG: hypothetical protein ABIR32_01365 [Ilumatobacteraceae bacterium]
MALVVLALLLLGAVGYATRRANLVPSAASRTNIAATATLRYVGDGLMVVSTLGCLLLIGALIL